MDTGIFITAAYTITGALLALIIVTTWAHARKVNARLKSRDQ